MVKVVKREVSAPRTEVEKDMQKSAALFDVHPEAIPGLTLDKLGAGHNAVILGISADPALRMHLMELGFVAGSPIAFLMSTPFGDPNIYSLRGTSIALRKSEAQCIRVKI